MYGAVLLVPHFSASRYADYSRLGRIGRGRRADLALHRIVAGGGARRAPDDRFNLFGVSAGAQFAHRYAMAYPRRVAFAVIADAGRYTLPDPTRRFPRGIRSTSKLPGRCSDPDAFLRVPMKVFVGADHGASVNGASRRPDGEPRAARAERARQWVAAMQESGRACRVDAAVAYELPDRIRLVPSSVMRGGLAERASHAMLRLAAREPLGTQRLRLTAHEDDSGAPRRTPCLCLYSHDDDLMLRLPNTIARPDEVDPLGEPAVADEAAPGEPPLRVDHRSRLRRDPAAGEIVDLDRHLVAAPPVSPQVPLRASGRTYPSTALPAPVCGACPASSSDAFRMLWAA